MTVAPEDGDHARRAVLGAVVPGLALAAAGVVAVVDHRPARAGASFAAAIVLVHLALLSSRYRIGLARVVGRVGTAVGWVLTTALLLPTFLVASAVGAAGRAAGRLAGRPAPRGWQVTAAEGPSSRPFGREAGRAGAGVSATDRRWLVRRATIRTVAVLVVLELLAGGLYYLRTRPARTTYGGVSAPGSTESAALRGLPWVPEASREAAAVSQGEVYTSYVGTSLRDYSGRYFNVKDRVRKSYEAPAGRSRPLDVWFFGASTMFGFDLQRDDHTIPSEIVRLAERDGLSVRAWNFGAPGYVNYTEAVLLGLLLGKGRRPDLVVFYDGINDESAQVFNVVDGTDPAGEPTYVTAESIRQALAASADLPAGPAGAPTPLAPKPLKIRPVTTGAIVDATVGVYREGIELVRTFAARYGFGAQFYWQPTMFSKKALDPGEQTRLRQLDIDSYRLATTRAIDRRIRADLPTGVHDLGAALDHLSGPVFTDQAHTNERGALGVAEGMYATLGPRLKALAATQRGHG